MERRMLLPSRLHSHRRSSGSVTLKSFQFRPLYPDVLIWHVSDMFLDIMLIIYANLIFLWWRRPWWWWWFSDVSRRDHEAVTPTRESLTSSDNDAESKCVKVDDVTTSARQQRQAITLSSSSSVVVGPVNSALGRLVQMTYNSCAAIDDDDDDDDDDNNEQLRHQRHHYSHRRAPG